MTILETSVTSIVPTQIPLVIREEGPLFEAFLKAYYEWEQTEGKGTYFARRFLDLRDVDTTTDQFLLLIKEKFLKNIRLETETNTRLLVKHATDFYQAKGTERALDLFFRLLYNEVVKIYYPKDDLFVLSDGVWKQPTYLELSLSSDNILLEDKKIVGLTTGATAFVDSVVRRIINGRLIDTAYISAIDKDFLTGEIVAPEDNSLEVGRCPTVIGSMNQVVISQQGSGTGFSVGDVVRINSQSGVGGIARVAKTQDQAGLLSIDLTDGGSGYSANAVIHVSNTVLQLQNVVVSNAQAIGYFPVFDFVKQATFRIFFSGATGTFGPGNKILTWANSVISGSGTVLVASYSNSTAGSLVVSPDALGLGASNTYFSPANTFSISLNIPGGGFVDISPKGRSLGVANVNLRLVNNSNPFSLGDTIIQTNPLYANDPSALGTGEIVFVSNNSIQIENIRGYFNPGRITNGVASVNVASVSLDVGLFDVTGQFSTILDNVIDTGSIRATAYFVSGGLSSSFAAANNLVYSETVSVNTDLLGPIANLMIAGPYGLAGNTSANSSTPFQNYLTFANVSVGTLTSVYAVAPGLVQDRAPMVFIEEPRTVDRNIFGYSLDYTGASGSFSNGEVITQVSGGRGLIMSVNATSMLVRDLRYSPNNALLVTSNSATIITGSMSGATANLVSVKRDSDFVASGRNATANASVATGNGAILTVDVLDSGLGYQQGEVVWLGNSDFYGAGAGTGVVTLKTYGKASGFYKEKGGFLSDQKKLFDGYYYQNFSYELASSKTLDKYQDTIKSTVHVAGMMLFGRYLHSKKTDQPITSKGSKYTKMLDLAGLRLGASVGTSSVSAVGQAAKIAIGSSAGTSMVFAGGQGAGVVSGISTVLAFGQAAKFTTGSSAGTSSVSGGGASTGGGSSNTSNLQLADGIYFYDQGGGTGGSTATGSGSANGSSIVSGIGATGSSSQQLADGVYLYDQ
jgi:hypothetical protein